MALPMLTALRTLHPGARITWLCGKSIRPLLDLVPAIDERIEIDDSRLFAPRSAARAAEVLRTWRVLAARRFDLVLMAHRDRRYRLLTRSIRHGELRALHDAKPRAMPICGRSHADEYIRLATGVDDWRARHYEAPMPRLEPGALVTRLKTWARGRRVVALAPGGARNSARTSPLKRWPLDRYVQLARELSGDGYAVCIAGDASDTWVSEAFHGCDVLDLVGKTSFAELLSVFSNCDAVVAHDSGPMHIAAWMRAPVVALFGPTLPSAFTPRDRVIDVLWPGRSLACAPCYDGREFASCDNNVCMQMIDVKSVAERVREVARRVVEADAHRARP